jgi:outer membrane protein assembly factor BamB
MIPRSLISALTVTTLGAACLADDWPQWRGPGRDGVWREPGILAAFPPEGAKVLWRMEAGSGWASPVVAGGRVFLSDSELKDAKARERLRCFDVTNGKLLWTYAYDVSYPDWAFGADQNAGPTATPVIVDEKVYMLGGSGEVACLAQATGEVLWQNQLGKLHTVETLCCRPSPLVEGDLLIIHLGGKPGATVLALDRRTGREVWKALDEPMSSSSPMVAVGAGKRQLIVWTLESVTSLDPATGATFWREPMTTSGNDAVATPVSVGDRLLVSGLMLKLETDRPAASVLWPENRGVTKRILSSTSTPFFADGFIVSATNKGDLVCLDAETGAELWKTDKVTDRKTGPSIHITPNGATAFLYTNLGDLIHARFSRAGYEEISRAHLLDPLMPFAGRKVTWSPPSYANRCVFVRNERELVCASLAADGAGK